MKEDFWLLKPKERAVAIAQDVIAQLDIQFIRASKGIYYDASRSIRVEEGGLDTAFENMKKEGRQCDVCAIGACFISMILLGDEVQVKDLTQFEDETEIHGMDSTTMRKHLMKAFPIDNIHLIESAFEMSVWGNQETPEMLSATLFGVKCTSPNSRLRAIMQNIIENNGTFIP